MRIYGKRHSIIHNWIVSGTFHVTCNNHMQDTPNTIINQQCTHSTQGFWGGIPGQATNKKLSMNRICTCNAFYFFCNWRKLGPSLCLNMQTNTCAHGQSHSLQLGAILLCPTLVNTITSCMHHVKGGIPRSEKQKDKHKMITNAHYMYATIKPCLGAKRDFESWANQCQGTISSPPVYFMRQDLIIIFNVRSEHLILLILKPKSSI